MCKIFSLVPSKKALTRENWDKLSVHFSIFGVIKFTIIQKKTFGTRKFGKIGVLVNFIIQKLKSKHSFCLSFLSWHVFEQTRENILNIFWAHIHFKGTAFCEKTIGLLAADPLKQKWQIPSFCMFQWKKNILTLNDAGFLVS